MTDEQKILKNAEKEFDALAQEGFLRLGIYFLVLLGVLYLIAKVAFPTSPPVKTVHEEWQEMEKTNNAYWQKKAWDSHSYLPRPKRVEQPTSGTKRGYNMIHIDKFGQKHVSHEANGLPTFISVEDRNGNISGFWQ